MLPPSHEPILPGPVVVGLQIAEIRPAAARQDPQPLAFLARLGATRGGSPGIFG